MNSINGKIFTGSDTYTTSGSAFSNKICYTPTSGKQVSLMGFQFSTTAANVVTIKLGTVTVAIFDVAAKVSRVVSGEEPMMIGAANGTINVTSTAANNLYISFWGREI